MPKMMPIRAQKAKAPVMAMMGSRSSVGPDLVYAATERCGADVSTHRLHFEIRHVEALWQAEIVALPCPYRAVVRSTSIDPIRCARIDGERIAAVDSERLHGQVRRKVACDVFHLSGCPPVDPFLNAVAVERRIEDLRRERIKLDIRE